jgi:hypothetical protein
LVTPFFVDHLSFILTSFRHYRAFIRAEKIYKIAISINDSIAKITSIEIKVYKVNQLLWESARVHNVNIEVCDHGPCREAILIIKRQESIVAVKTTL